MSVQHLKMDQTGPRLSATQARCEEEKLIPISHLGYYKESILGEKSMTLP